MEEQPKPSIDLTRVAFPPEERKLFSIMLGTNEPPLTTADFNHALIKRSQELANSPEFGGDLVADMCRSYILPVNMTAATKKHESK
jgi:hypothetical protein